MPAMMPFIMALMALSSAAPFENSPGHSASPLDFPAQSFVLAADIPAAEGNLSIHGFWDHWRTLATAAGSNVPTCKKAFRRDPTTTSRFSSGVVHFSLPFSALWSV